MSKKYAQYVAALFLIVPTLTIVALLLCGFLIDNAYFTYIFYALLTYIPAIAAIIWYFLVGEELEKKEKALAKQRKKSKKK